MVKLLCVIVGVAESVFTVDIDESLAVSELKDAIKPKISYSGPAYELRLFLAKTADGNWLGSDSEDVKKLKEGEETVAIEALTSKEKKLQAESGLQEVLAGMPKPSADQIHVLVDVPKQENDRTPAVALGVAPPLPPTTIHRHLERLKRWAAINAMIRQKNQEATREDAKKTIKKRKIDDIDKTVDHSSLCWEDIKPIYNFDDSSYDLQPSDVPDADIELLLARIVDVRGLYGRLSDGNETMRLFFIAPVLETVSRLLKDVRISVEEDVVGKNVLVEGRFEFVLERGTKKIAIVQAKREDMLQGVTQSVTGLEALADVEDLSVAYGIVTNFLVWNFLISDDTKVRTHEYSIGTTNSIPSFEGLKQLVGKIYAMLQ